MIIKLLGIIDIFIALCFWIFGVFHLNLMAGFIFMLGVYLLIKGVIFLTQLSFASILDVASAMIIIGSSASTFLMPNFVVIIVSLYLIQKGIFSLIA
jgi:hypothetical protein